MPTPAYKFYATIGALSLAMVVAWMIYFNASGGILWSYVFGFALFLAILGAFVYVLSRWGYKIVLIAYIVAFMALSAFLINAHYSNINAPQNLQRISEEFRANIAIATLCNDNPSCVTRAINSLSGRHSAERFNESLERLRQVIGAP